MDLVVFPLLPDPQYSSLTFINRAPCIWPPTRSCTSHIRHLHGKHLSYSQHDNQQKTQWTETLSQQHISICLAGEGLSSNPSVTQLLGLCRIVIGTTPSRQPTSSESESVHDDNRQRQDLKTANADALCFLLIQQGPVSTMVITNPRSTTAGGVHTCTLVLQVSPSPSSHTCHTSHTCY